MKFKVYLGLFLAAVMVGCAAAWLEKAPGYMDAEYYYGGALRLAQGQGFTEPYLWNYLDDPAGIPHPSNTYWMPLASVMAAAGMLVTGQLNFSGARLFFVLLAGLIAPLTAHFAFRFSKKVAFAVLAGVLAIFPGYYLAFIVDTETFTLYFVLGSLFLLVAFADWHWLSGKYAFARPLLLGLIAGGMHLSRADGILWLAAALGLVGWESFSRLKKQVEIPFHRRYLLAGGTLLCLLAGYVLVMGSWYARNISLYGGLFSPGGAKTLWLANYNQTFSYPAGQLTWQSWAGLSLSSHLKIWWDALVWNLKNALAVQGGVFLFLLILPGLWALRRQKMVRFAVLMWLFTLAIMTFVFPFAGSQGGFLHSGSAIQPVLWAMVPFGLDGFIKIGVRLRHWNAQKSWPVFATAVAVLCGLFTLVIFWSRVVGSDLSQPVWSQSDRQYTAVTRALQDLGAGSGQRVLVNNPPGYYLASGGEGLVIPDGNVSTLLAVAQRYKAGYLVLEPNHVAGLDDLYQHPGSLPGLVYVKNISGSVFIYRIAIPAN
jgi:hypothetical protein